MLDYPTSTGRRRIKLLNFLDLSEHGSPESLAPFEKSKTWASKKAKARKRGEERNGWRRGWLRAQLIYGSPPHFRMDKSKNLN
jgi:hypothetical protein